MPIEDMAKYKREWLQARRKAFIESRGNKCALCDATDVPFDIDHIDRTTKEYKITEIWSRTEQVRNKELDKCQLLCKPCHKHKTSQEMRKDLKHGDLGMYKTRKCRCELCRAENTRRKNLRTRAQRERNEQLAR
jgi:hypothetical protein